MYKRGLQSGKVSGSAEWLLSNKEKKESSAFSEGRNENFPNTKRFRRYMYEATPFSELIC